jgi:hypothetical protein
MSLSARFFGGVSEQNPSRQIHRDPCGEIRRFAVGLRKLFRPCTHGSMSQSQEQEVPVNHSIPRITCRNLFTAGDDFIL